MQRVIFELFVFVCIAGAGRGRQLKASMTVCGQRQHSEYGKHDVYGKHVLIIVIVCVCAVGANFSVANFSETQQALTFYRTGFVLGSADIWCSACKKRRCVAARSAAEI